MSNEVLKVDAKMQEALLDRARTAARFAYVPYSRFPVGAAALASDGSIFTGCNVENASYGLTICAERVAIGTAVAAGQREIVAVAVAAPKKPLTTPCGACRQFLHEFRPAAEDMVVLLDDGQSGVEVSLNELLPRSFGPGHLDDEALETASSDAVPDIDRAR